MNGISIVICSRNEKIANTLSINIEETIGCEFELIIIDNSKNNYSIFEAYNLGLEKCTEDFICFLHDDIFIRTNNWGKIIIEIFFKNPSAGLLGIAGGKNKSRMPSGWSESGKNVLFLIQHYKNKPSLLWNKGFHNSQVVEVATIDGVFMAMRADKNIGFDERLKGFHNYDINLSLVHHILKKKIVVTDRILIEHFSEGIQDKSWYTATSLFHKLYKKNLPLIKSENIQIKKFKNKEFQIGSGFVSNLLEHKLYKDAFYWWFQILWLKPVSKYHFKFMKHLIRSHIKENSLRTKI